MIESFFPSLKHRGVEHLLISGQATVLYGAATLENIFTLSALTTFFETHPGAVELTEGEQAAALKSFGRHVITGQDAPEQIEEELNTWMQRRMAALQQADRRYWRDIIAELKKLRSTGQLMPDGSQV